MKNQGTSPDNSTGPLSGYRPLQIAKALGLSKSLVYAAIRNGELKAIQIGTALIVMEADLQRWLEDRRL